MNLVEDTRGTTLRRAASVLEPGAPTDLFTRSVGFEEQN